MTDAMNDIAKLGLQRCRELGQAAFTAHEELERWRQEPLKPMQRTELSVALKQAIEEQNRWLRAIEETLEEDATR